MIFCNSRPALCGSAVRRAWLFIQQMNPAADTLALATVEVDISAVEVGQAIKVKWRGVPVFIRHRTKAEIDAANAAKPDDLIDPEEDGPRAEAGFADIGRCLHPSRLHTARYSQGETKGEFDGWFCPCHGSTTYIGSNPQGTSAKKSSRPGTHFRQRHPRQDRLR